MANVHMLMEAYRHPEFFSVLKNADIVTPDGMPLVWMMRLMGAWDQNRVAGMDILLSVCKLAQEQNLKVFFLGSKATILETMRKKLEHEFPDLQIAGMEPLPFRPLTSAEDSAIIQKINASGAGLVFVSLGCPKQEYWMNQHKGKIQAVMIGLGGVFPVLAEVHKRVPLWGPINLCKSGQHLFPGTVGRLDINANVGCPDLHRFLQGVGKNPVKPGSL